MALDAVETPVVVEGEWTWEKTIKVELSYGGTGYIPWFRCSKCGVPHESYLRYDEPMEEDADFPRYCEYCGAKMKNGRWY